MNKLQLNKIKYTKEVLHCLERSFHVKSEKDILEPFQLCISLLLHSKLIQSLLGVNTQTINTLTSRYYITNQSYKLKRKVVCRRIVNILTLLNRSNYICNTVILFYFLLENDYSSFRLVSEIIALNPLTILLRYMNYAPSLSIPNKFKKYISINDTSGTLSVLGREKELQLVDSIINDSRCSSLIFVGKEGIGKKTIITKFINSCGRKKMCLTLDSFNLLKVKDITIIDSLFEYLESISGLVLYIKDLHLLFNNPSYDNLTAQIRDILFFKLDKKEIQIIGEVVEKERIDTKWLEHINVLPTHELNSTMLVSILNNYNRRLRVKYGKNLVLSDNIFNSIIELGMQYMNKYAFPKKGFIILESLYSKINGKVTENIIIDSIAEHDSSIYMNNVRKNTKSTMEKIEHGLQTRIYGQEIVLNKVFSTLKRSLTGAKDATKPLGSFLFCGPSGTGKTELVKSLSDLFMKSSLVRFDMSEYMEKHSISKLIGCPPGYVGHEEGGLLTESIKRKPHSVILFDEIEKAHPDINNIMLQLLDEGRVTDSKGNTIDCTNTIIIYTSNLGCPTTPEGFESYLKGTDVSDSEYKILCSRVDKATKNFFKPEFLNRLDAIVVFRPLSIKYLVSVLDKFIVGLERKFKASKIPIIINLTLEAKFLLAKIAYHPLYGARPLKRIINQSVEKPISDLVINYRIKTPHIFSIFIKNKELNYSFKRV